MTTHFLPDAAGGNQDTLLDASLGSEAFTAGLAYLANSGLVGVHMTLLNLRGWRLGPSDTSGLAILTPSATLDALFVGGQSKNLFVAVGGSLIGLQYATCSAPVPFFVQLRAPTYALWLPALAAGGEIGSKGTEAFSTWGFNLRAGIFLF